MDWFQQPLTHIITDSEYSSLVPPTPIALGDPPYKSGRTAHQLSADEAQTIARRVFDAARRTVASRKSREISPLLLA